jgi:hypothetical protein
MIAGVSGGVTYVRPIRLPYSFAYLLSESFFELRVSTRVLGRRLFDMVRRWLHEPCSSNRYASN